MININININNQHQHQHRDPPSVPPPGEGRLANTAACTAANLKPGSTGSKCIAVTSTGNLASTVKLYGTNAASTKNLAWPSR